MNTRRAARAGQRDAMARDACASDSDESMWSLPVRMRRARAVARERWGRGGGAMGFRFDVDFDVDFDFEVDARDGATSRRTDEGGDGARVGFVDAESERESRAGGD